MLLGQDGEWHPITKTPGLRRFAKNWNSRSRKGPSNAKGTRLVVIPLWCLNRNYGWPKDPPGGDRILLFENKDTRMVLVWSDKEACFLGWVVAAVAAGSFVWPSLGGGELQQNGIGCNRL
jgi:hypothetical protein